MEDKIRGMILGHALADALGAPHEFGRNSPMYTGRLEHAMVRNSQWQGKRVAVVGQVTDDTEMALALADSISHNGEYVHAIFNYMKWVNSGCAFLGKNTRALFHGIKTLRGYNNRYKKAFPNEEAAEQAQSNGCLMRAYPLAFARDDEMIEVDVRITNPSSVAVECVKLYVHALKDALSGKPKSEIYNNARQAATIPCVEEALDQALDMTFRDVTVMRGWVVHGLYCAFYGLMSFDDYQSAIDAVITLSPEKDKTAYFSSFGQKSSSKSVGDTDTNGCIAGALLGAYYGMTAMEENENVVENVKILHEANPDQGDFKRPETYLITKERVESIVQKLHSNNLI